MSALYAKNEPLRWRRLAAVALWLSVPIAVGMTTPVSGQPATDGPAHLGNLLFNDRQLSADRSVSCATCHRPDRAWSDGLSVSLGAGGRAGNRNAPSLLDAAKQRTLFWDGRVSSLADQVPEPMFNPVEHGLASQATLLELVRANADYVARFRSSFGVESDAIAMPHIAEALAAYMTTLTSGPSPFDRLLAGDAKALEPAAERGWKLFTGTAQCIRCHVVEGARPLLTDHAFHSLAVGIGKVSNSLSGLAARAVQLREQQGRTAGEVLQARPETAELGRFVVTLSPPDIGKFKTPPLRNVALTAPYMHDGSVQTLEAAVDLEVHYRGLQSGRPLVLSPQERADLVAFLRALTSEPLLDVPASPAQRSRY